MGATITPSIIVFSLSAMTPPAVSRTGRSATAGRVIGERKVSSDFEWVRMPAVLLTRPCLRQQNWFQKTLLSEVCWAQIQWCWGVLLHFSFLLSWVRAQDGSMCEDEDNPQWFIVT